MTIDALSLAAICKEANELAVGRRIQKIIPTGPLSVAVEVYNPAYKRRVQLLLSADAQNARFHLLNQKVSQMPGDPTPFLLVLRRYIRYGIITKLEQIPFERIITLSIAKKFPAGKRPRFNLMGGPISLEVADDFLEDQVDFEEESLDREGDVFEIYESKLICEIMGRHSNIFLLSEDNIIIDAIKRVASGRNRYRVILPHHKYISPPPQEKKLFYLESPASFDKIMEELRTRDPKGLLWQKLVSSFSGVSPQLAREIAFRLAEKSEQIGLPQNCDATLENFQNWDDLFLELNAFLRPLTPAELAENPICSVVRETDGTIVAFAPYELRQFKSGGLVPEQVMTLSLAAEEYYGQTEAIAGQAQRKKSIENIIIEHQEKLQKRAFSLRESLKKAESAELQKRKGEAIYSHIYEISKGMQELEADGLKISLDPELNPSENAQLYFREYDKARKALAGVPELLAETNLKQDYLDEMLTQLDLAENYDEVMNINAELAVEGYAPLLKGDSKTKSTQKQKKRRLPKTPTYYSSDGYTIYVGKSAQHNEFVTFKLGDKQDLWLHARGMPGSHVIVKNGGENIPEKTLLEAAALAGYYSKGRENTKVEITYVNQKYVKKVKGTHPGLVTYINDNSVSIKPKKIKQK